MNHYQISGIVILILVALLALFTFWPANHIPSVEVTFPSVPAGETTDDAAAEVKPTATTPKPAAPAAPAPSTSGAGVRTFEKGYYVTTIYYTDQGFSPATIEINNGEEVRFVNRTSGALRINAEGSSSSQYYRAISQPNTVFKGGTYQMQLPEVGVFNYFNVNSTPKKSGQIIIK